jgi:hypothetical protein
MKIWFLADLTKNKFALDYAYRKRVLGAVLTPSQVA